MNDYEQMTDIERIMLSDKFTVLITRNGETIARFGFYLTIEDAIENLTFPNELDLISCIFRQGDEGVSIVNLSEVLGANHAA